MRLSASKRKLRLVSALILGMTSLSACGVAAGQTVLETDTVRIGVAHELTGWAEYYGAESLRGIELATQQINQAGGVRGKPIELVTYDTASVPTKALTETTRLVMQDRVLAVIGPTTSASALTTVSIGEIHHVPIIFDSATADELTTNGTSQRLYNYRTCVNNSTQAAAMVNYALTTVKARSAAILIDETSVSSVGLAASFKEAFKADGGTVVVEESFDPATIDYWELFGRIKEKPFDVVYAPSLPNEAGTIIRVLREAGVGVPVLGDASFESPKLGEIAGEEILSNVFYTTHFSVLEQPTSQAREFIEAYRAQYEGADPSAFAAQGYDTMRLLADRIESAVEMSGQSLDDALETALEFEGVTGTFNLTEVRDPKKSVVVVSLQSGVATDSASIPT